MKTSLRCEEVYFQQWEHINGGFCRLVLVLPFQLSVSSAQNATVPNMFLIFYKFPVRKLVSILTKKVFCAVVLRSHSRLSVDLIRKNYLNWKRWIEQVDFSQQNSWFFWPFYFSLGFFDYNKTIWLLLFEKYSSRIRKNDIWSQKCGQWTNE